MVAGPRLRNSALVHSRDALGGCAGWTLHSSRGGPSHSTVLTALPCSVTAVVTSQPLPTVTHKDR